MPTLIAEIEHVGQAECGHDLIDYTITAITPEKTWQFQTFNAWIASACDAAHTKQMRVAITYNDSLLSRWGRRWKPRVTEVKWLSRIEAPCRI